MCIRDRYEIVGVVLKTSRNFMYNFLKILAFIWFVGSFPLLGSIGMIRKCAIQIREGVQKGKIL